MSRLVSAVIPAYNAGPVISDAIESVLAQTYSPVECIVVDDGSTDNTIEVARSYLPDIHIISSERLGVAAARNRGVEFAGGTYIAFLDADDVWLPIKISVLVDVLSASPHAGFAYCGLQKVDQDLKPLELVCPPGPRELIRNVLLAESPSVTAIFGLIPKAILNDVGGFDERLSTGADSDLTCKIARNYEITGLQTPLTLWRQHDGQMHRNPELLMKDRLTVISRYLDCKEMPEDWPLLKNRALANLFLMLAIAYQRDGSWGKFARYLGQAVAHDPVRVLSRLGELVWERKLTRRLPRGCV